MAVGAPGRGALDQLGELMDFSMKPRASFAFGSLNFTVNQDREVAHQDDLLDASCSNRVIDKTPDELPEVN
jgi:hypothetical protein